MGMGMGRSGGGSDMDKGGRKPDAGFSRVLDVDCSKGTPEDRRKGEPRVQRAADASSAVQTV